MKTTICISTHQRREKLQSLLVSITSSVENLPKNIAPPAVFVSVDGSTDGTVEMLSSWKEDFPLELEFAYKSNGGPASTRNLCIDSVKDGRVWFLDDDMIINSNALSLHCSEESGTRTILMGPCVIPGSAGPDSRGVMEYYTERHERLVKQVSVTDPTDFSPANTSGDVGLFKEIKFNETFSKYGYEDFEFAIRALAAGIKIRFEPNSQIEHAHDIDRIGILNTLRGMAHGKIIFATLHPEFDITRLPGDASVINNGSTLSKVILPVLASPLWRIATGVTSVVGDYRGRGSSRLWRFAQNLAIRAGRYEALRVKQK